MIKILLSALAFSVSFFTPNTGLSAPRAGHMGSGKPGAKNSKVAVTNIQVKRSAAGVAIDLTFDRGVSAKSLKPGFERNFVQFVLKSTSMDSARMIPVSESEVQKVFAYPYSRDTARLRVIFKHDNQWAKGKTSVWNNSPRSVRIFIKDPQVTAAAHEAQKPAKLPAPAQAVANVEESTLLKEVINNTRDIDIQNPDSVKAALSALSPQGAATPPAASALSATNKTQTPEQAATSPHDENPALGTKTDPSRNFMRMAAALFGVLALFIGSVFAVRKYAGKLKKLPFGKKERLIQVVATHYLGNKKSISLVKITGEYMVVGVSNDGISLISKLGPEINVDKYLEDRFWGGTFEKHLNAYASDKKVAKEIDLEDLAEAPAIPAASKYDGPRDLSPQVAEVSDKVELSPVRASIKEKLLKLKPLA